MTLYLSNTEADLRMATAQQNSVKRDLIYCQKRPNIVSKETYYSVKRDLIYCQKRPNIGVYV